MSETLNKQDRQLLLNEIRRKLDHYERFPKLAGSTEREMIFLWSEYELAHRSLEAIAKVLETSKGDEDNDTTVHWVHDIVVNGYFQRVKSVIRKWVKQ